MSDQETAIQLIRNEAAELIVRAKAAGLSITVSSGVMCTFVDVAPLPADPRGEYRYAVTELKKFEGFQRLSAEAQIGKARYFSVDPRDVCAKEPVEGELGWRPACCNHSGEGPCCDIGYCAADRERGLSTEGEPK